MIRSTILLSTGDVIVSIPYFETPELIEAIRKANNRLQVKECERYLNEKKKGK